MKPIAFSTRELTQMLEHIEPTSAAAIRDRAALILIRETDLLVHELCGLVIGHTMRKIFPRRTLLVPAPPGRRPVCREVPLTAAAQQAIGALLDYNIERGFSVAAAAPLLTNAKGTFFHPRDFMRRLEAYSPPLSA